MADANKIASTVIWHLEDVLYGEIQREEVEDVNVECHDADEIDELHRLAAPPQQAAAAAEAT